MEPFQPPDITLPITDNDAEEITLTPAPASIAEGATSTVTASVPSAVTGSALSITVDATAGTNTETADFTQTGRTLTIPVGATSSATGTGTVTIMAENDDFDEGNQAVTLTASATGYQDATTATLTITDDPNDTAALTVTETSGSTEVTEASGAGNTDRFDVRLATRPVGTSVVVTVSTASTVDECDVSVDDGTNYLDAGTGGTDRRTLTFLPAVGESPAAGETLWSTAQTVTVRGTDDMDLDGDTTGGGSDNTACRVVLDVSSPTLSGGDAKYHALSDRYVDVTVRDNEARATLAITAASDTINESGAGNSTTVTASLPAGETAAAEMTIDLEFTPTSPAVAGDYSLTANRRLRIAQGDRTSTGLVRITAVDNSVDAPDKAVVVSGDAMGAGALDPARVTLTIADDDAAPTASLQLSDASIAETGGTSQVTAHLDRASSEATTVTVTPVSGHYTVESDAVIVIAAGSVTDSEQVTITAVGNSVDEANRRERVTATAVNSQGLSNTSCTSATPPVCTVSGPHLTLEDDDTAPGVTLSVANATIAESGPGNTTTVSATLTGGTSDVDTTVTVLGVSGAYTVGSSNTITIPAGSASGSGTVTITAVDDTRDEPGSTTVTGTAVFANNRGSATVTGAALTITDNDAAPGVALSVAPSSISEDGGTSQVSASLTGGTTSSAATTVTVTVSTTGGYTVPSTANTITIAADATSGAGTVTITAVDNDADAADLSTTVTGTVANSHDGRTAAAATAASLTITDDDTAGLTLSKTSVTTSEDESTDTFTVRLSTQPTANVTVAVASSDTTEATVSPMTLTFTTMNWDTAQTVTVTGVDDNPAEQDGQKDYTITLNPDSAAGSAGDATYRDNTAVPTVDVSGRNRDNEAPTVELLLSPATVSEGGRATVRARLDGNAVPEATTVTVQAAAASPATSGDFRLSGTELRIPANATASSNSLTLTAVDDRVDGPEEMRVTVSGTAAGGQGAADPDDVTLTIEDDEAAPTVTLSAASGAIWEDGGTTTVSARLSHASIGATTVTVQAVAGVYTLGADATIVIPAGRTTSGDRVTVTAVDNAARSDADRTVTVPGTAVNDRTDVPAAMRLGALTGARLTVWDDETASVSLLLEPARVAEGGAARVSARMDGNRPSRAALTLTVSAAPGTNATASSFALGPSRTLTVAAGATASADAVEILATDDEVDAPDRTVTITAAVGAGSRARRPEAVTLTIADDDETPRAILALTPAVIDESGATNAATVTATLERASSEATTIAVSAAGTGFRQRGTELTIAAGSTASAGTVTLTAVDDEERNEDREVRVSGRAENAHGVEQPAVAVLTIRDDDGTEEVTALLLPETARAMADSRATAVRQRLARAASGAAAAPSEALPALTGLLERHGPSAQQDDLDWKRDLLPQASFALPLDAAGGAGGGLVVWGGGDYRDLDGEARGVKWDGEVASAHLGADRLLANGLRLGLAGSWSEATFDYERRNQQGEWKLEMGSAQPYLGWTTPGGTLLWASAGYGEGELELDRGGGRVQTSDADMRMAAAGAAGPVYASADGLEVSLRGEALYSRFEVDGNGDDIRGHESEATRLRLAVEARRERVLASGARLSPRFELGARHDGGDGETGSGAEVGAGVDYASGRLTAAAGARALVANSDYDEWGANLALAYAPGADGRGLAFRLAPSWGATRSGTAALWEQGAAELDGAAAEPAPGARVTAALGYGLRSPLGRGLLTLAAGGEWGEDAGSVCRLSGTVALDATASLGLELELRAPQSGDAGRSLMLKAELRF